MKKIILLALACSMFILPSCKKESSACEATVEYSSNISYSGRTFTNVPVSMVSSIQKTFDIAANEFKNTYSFTGSGANSQEAIENADKKMTESVVESEVKRAEAFVSSFTAALKLLGLPDNAEVVYRNVTLEIIREKSSVSTAEIGVSVLVKSVPDIVYP